MCGYLRFTPDEYRAVLEASRPLGLASGYDAFRRALADALGGSSPALAGRIAALSDAQARLLREHLETTRATPEPGADKGPDLPLGEWRSLLQALGLSFPEWQSLSRACALALLRSDDLMPEEVNLARLVREEQPALAEKLEGLTAGQLARLCIALRSGRRSRLF